MQIYKDMSIGTAKPTKEEMQGIVHHMIDVVSPSEVFSCADYKTMAQKILTSVYGRGMIPIFCGGTGLYLDSVISGNPFSSPASDEKIKNSLIEELNEKGIDHLHKRLTEIDPESAEKIHKNNVKRVIRALEIYLVSGKTKTEWDLESKNFESDYHTVIIGLDYKDRDILYSRCDKRVDIMIEEGLEAEVRALYDKGLICDLTTAGQAIGYKEFVPYFEKKINLDDVIESIKLNTRHYVKRQLTWFKRYENINWVYPDIEKDFESLTDTCLEIINSHL